jgi:predicted PurR-regulated permease PerM
MLTYGKSKPVLTEPIVKKKIENILNSHKPEPFITKEAIVTNTKSVLYWIWNCVIKEHIVIISIVLMIIFFLMYRYYQTKEKKKKLKRLYPDDINGDILLLLQTLKEKNNRVIKNVQIPLSVRK